MTPKKEGADPTRKFNFDPNADDNLFVNPNP